MAWSRSVAHLRPRNVDRWPLRPRPPEGPTSAAIIVPAAPVLVPAESGLVIPVVAPVILVPPLTRRQEEVWLSLAMGASIKQTAMHLGLSPRTVETYRSQLMERLGIHDVASLTRAAVRLGRITP